MLIVTVNPDSTINNVSIQVSTGDLMKDKEAVHEAKSFTYKAATYRLLVTIASVN